MSEPQTINAYLAELNACLELGFRSRLRVFREVVDHFAQAVSKEVDDGASPAVAERRAIAAFGSPEEVARSFEAGLVGALDKRLALSTRRIRGWMASHAWGAAAIKAAFLTMVLAVGTAVGAVSGAKHPMTVLILSPLGVWWALWFRPQAPLRGRVGARIRALTRRLSKGPKRKSGPLDPNSYAMLAGSFCAYPTVSTWLTMVDGYDRSIRLPFWQFFLWISLVIGSQYAALWATHGVVKLAARRRAPATEEAGPRSWKAEHPWRTALFDVWSVPLGALALVLIYPAPLGLRVAFTVLLVATTGLLAAGLRLVRSQEEKSSYARRLENPK